MVKMLATCFSTAPSEMTRAVEKHVANIFTKFDLPVSQSDHRRVLAVLRDRKSVV